MNGTIYFYYDKALVTNCKQRNLYPYVGKVKRNAVVQLIVYPHMSKDTPFSTPAGISVAGDFYNAALPGGILYQIHKNGKLIRAYTPDISLMEETIMEVPMAILAMLQGKLLLRSSFAVVKDSAYAVIGETEMGKANGMMRDDIVLISGRGMKYKATTASFPGVDASRMLEEFESPGLKGICMLRHGGKRTKTVPVVSLQSKKSLLVENHVGFNLLPHQLKQQIWNSEILKQASQTIPITSIAVPEGIEKSEWGRKKVLRLMAKR